MDKLYIIDAVLYPCKYSMYVFFLFNLYDIDISQGKNKRIMISCMLGDNVVSENILINDVVKIVRGVSLSVHTTFHHFKRHPIDILYLACNTFRKESLFRILHG